MRSLPLIPLLLCTLAAPALTSCQGEHGAAGPAAEEAEDPRPDIAVTLYQNGLELFMEYPAFAVGQESPLIAHFTDTSPSAG